MKILFICKSNVRRSQIAEELFNHYTFDHIGLSAGTHAAQFNGKKLKECAHHVVDVLKERGIDVSDKTPIQLTPEHVQFTDKIIVITDKNSLPSYLISSTKVEYWDVQDAEGKDYKFHIELREKIDILVIELLISLMKI